MMIGRLVGWIKDVNAKHKYIVKNNGYVFNKWLITGFFVLALLGLAVVVGVEGFTDKVYVVCDSGLPCVNPLKELGCQDFCCTLDFIPPMSSCGERPSWLARNYSSSVVFLFLLVLLLNHLFFNKGYDFDKYWGDWK